MLNGLLCFELVLNINCVHSTGSSKHYKNCFSIDSYLKYSKYIQNSALKATQFMIA